MGSDPVQLVPYEEYLARERASATKHEFIDGSVYARAGGSPEHARLQVRVSAALSAALGKRPCAVFSSDLRVHIAQTRRSTYPDVTVVCGPLERAKDDPDAVTNPTVIIEVLSDGTERSDRGEKFAHYRRLSSLREYVLVAQDQPLVEVFRREPQGWVLTEFGPGQTLRLTSLDVSLEVDELYFDPTNINSPTNP
jgi:Uma2 family endonuclease